MWTIQLSFLIFTLVIFDVTGFSQYHCCQNDLCPIDCIRCDGKPTCYDLSDELGCNNETDKRLLSYEKPPVFVPSILAVLKAQLRRDKVELSYRFPDRNCFESITSSPVTTTETPVWLRLLIKLKESLGITTPTTTTTEMPIWKMLMNRLRAEQNGEVYTITPPTKQWTEKNKVTPPWRRTAIPPVTKAPTTSHHITSEISKKTTTPITIQTTTESIKTPETKAIEVKVTTNSIGDTSSAVREQRRDKTNDATTISMPKEKITKTIDMMTTQMTSQSSTDMSDQTTKVITEPLATTEKVEPSISDLNNQSHTETTEQTVFTSTLERITPGTIKQTVFFTRPQQQIVTERNQQKIVTPIVPKSNTSISPDTTTQSAIQAVAALSSERSDGANFEEGVTSVHFLRAVNDTLHSSFVRKGNLLNVEVNMDINTNITEENIKSNISTTNDVLLTEKSTINTSNVSLETNFTTELNANQAQEIFDENVKPQSIYDIVSITTDLPLLLATADFGVTMSTEYAKTVTESETPAPLPEKGMLSARDDKILHINKTKIKVGNTESIVYLNKLQLPVYGKENTNVQEFVNTSSFVKNATKSEKNISEISNITKPSLQSDISEVNKLVDNLLSNYSNSNVSLLSGNLTSSDFIFPSLESKMKETKNGQFNYNVDESKLSLQGNSNSGYSLRETNIRGFELNNNSNKNVVQATTSSILNRNDDVAVTIVEKQKHIIGPLKDRVATSSIQANPENEVRIMLGKLNALVRKALDSSSSRSKPVLNEFSQAKSGATIANNVKLGIPAFTFAPTTMGQKLAVEQTRKPFFNIQPATNAPTKQYQQNLQSNNVQNTFQSQVLHSQNVKIQNEQPKHIQPLLTFPSINKPKDTQPSAINTHVINPAVIPPPVKPTEAAPSSNVQNVQSYIATISPWWGGTTLSPFSLDNLFGYTTQPPLIDNNWFDPTTSAFSWDTMFGAGGIPVTQGATVPPYNADQNMLNDIFDPLNNNMHLQDTAVNQHTGYFGEVTLPTPPLLPSNNFGILPPSTPQIRPTREVRTRISTDSALHTTSKYGAITKSETTTNSFIPFSIHSKPNPRPGLTKTHITSSNLSTGKPLVSKTMNPSTHNILKVFDIFNTKRNSGNTGNFSIVTQPEKVTLGSFIKPTIKVDISNGIDTATTASSPVDTTSLPAVTTTLPAVTTISSAAPTISSAAPIIPLIVPEISTSKKDDQSVFLKTNNITTKSANKTYEEKTTKGFAVATSQPPGMLSENKQDVKIVYDTAKPRPVTPKLFNHTTYAPPSPVTSIIQTFWNVREYGKGSPTTVANYHNQPTTISPITGPPTTITNYNNQPTTKQYWSSGTSRVLSSNIISNWWEQVQPTTTSPVYVTQATPTPTAVSNLDQCYQMQDTTGFCQSRISGHFRNPEDCRSFYVCIWETLHSCSCPGNTMFDDKINVCNWDHLVTCK